MKIDSIQAYNNTNNYTKATPKANVSFGTAAAQTDTFVSSKQNENKVSFGRIPFFKPLKKDLTPEEKLSKRINSGTIDAVLLHNSAKEEAKEESRMFNNLFNRGLMLLGQSYQLREDKIYKAHPKKYDAFTYYSKLGTNIDTELQVDKGKPVKFIRTAIVDEGYDVETLDFTKEGFKYTEKVTDKKGRKIRTTRKINLVYLNGIGKSTYTERNDDGTFSTYVYQGSKNAITKRFDYFEPFRENVWTEYEKSTPNLARKAEKAS